MQQINGSARQYDLITTGDAHLLSAIETDVRVGFKMKFGFEYAAALTIAGQIHLNGAFCCAQGHIVNDEMFEMFLVFLAFV